MFTSIRLFQYLAAVAGVFSVISSGINLGWTSPYLPHLLSNSSTIPTTPNEGSWCAVMPLVGAPPGAVLAAFLADRIGRKLTILLLAFPTLFSFIGLAFAPNITIISIMRFIIGAVEGGLYTVLPMYIGEISDPTIRGSLTSLLAIAGIIGTLFINILGPLTSIFTSAFICALVPLLHFLLFFAMPKSPYYLIKKNRLNEAENSLKLLRRTDDVQNEMRNLCKAVEEQEKQKGKITDLFTIPGNRKACFIYLIINFTNKFSGKNPIIFYTHTIFEESGSTFISPYYSTIIYFAVHLFAVIIATTLVDKWGKRPLLIISTLGCCLSQFILACYFYMKDTNNFNGILEHIDWLPITSLLCYNILFSFGLAFGPVMVLSELFPTNIKATALCLADSSSVTLGTLVSKFFQITKDNFGIYVPFWFFSACCLFGLIFIIKFIPETKGKSLQEVQNMLTNSNVK